MNLIFVVAESFNDWQVASLIATMSMYLNLWRFAMSSIHDHCQWIHFNTFYISAFFLDLSQRVAHSCRCVSTMGWWVVCLRAHALDRRFWRLDDHAGAGGRRRTIQDEVDVWAPAMLLPNHCIHLSFARLFVRVNRRIQKTTRIMCSCVHVSFIICIGDSSLHMLKHIHIAHMYLYFFFLTFFSNIDWVQCVSNCFRRAMSWLRCGCSIASFIAEDEEKVTEPTWAGAAKVSYVSTFSNTLLEYALLVVEYNLFLVATKCFFCVLNATLYVVIYSVLFCIYNFNSKM